MCIVECECECTRRGVEVCVCECSCRCERVKLFSCELTDKGDVQAKCGEGGGDNGDPGQQEDDTRCGKRECPNPQKDGHPRKINQRKKEQ